MLTNNKKEKILVICGGGIFSGKEKVMLSLLRGLKEDGYDPLCITSYWNDGTFINSLREAGIPYEILKIGFISFSIKYRVLLMTLEQLLYVIPIWFLFLKIIRQHKPSIVIHTNYHHTLLLYPVLNNKQVHIYHCHELVQDKYVYIKIFRLFSNKISFFVGVSKFICTKLIELQIPESAIFCIPNGIEINEKVAITKRNQNLVKIGIVGQVGKWKGHEDVIAALEILNRETTKVDYVCLIFGKGAVEYEEYLKFKIAEKGLNSKVIWMGYQKDIELIYNDLDIVCVVSRCEEALGLTALEAASYSIPLIVSNRGGLVEIVRNGVNGFIVDAENPKQLAEKIKLLLENSQLRKQLGLTNHQMLQQRYSHQQFIENWINLFKLK